MSYERYKEKKNPANMIVRDTEVSADERWDRKMTKKFHKNKEMFCKEIHRIWKRTSENEDSLQAEDGTLLVEKEAVKKRWSEIVTVRRDNRVNV